MKSKYKISLDNVKTEPPSIKAQVDDLKIRIREFYPYFLGFYFLALIVSMFSSTWQSFFYWPAMHGSIIFFTLLYVCTINYRKILQGADIKTKLEKNKLNLSAKSEVLFTGFFGSVKSSVRVLYSNSSKFKIAFLILVKHFYGLIIRQGKICFLFVTKKLKSVSLISWIKIAIITAVLILALLLNIGVLEFLILSYGLISFIFILEVSWSAIAAAFLLGLCPIFLILKKDGLADIAAIYAYYFLIIIVLTQIRELAWKNRKQA